MKKRLIFFFRRLVGRLFPPHLSHYVGGAETLPSPLTAEEEAELMKRRETDPEAVRETLIVRNLRLVVYIARKFDPVGAGTDDLISIGTIGLIKAVNTYCPGRNIKLATYASRCIENEILMYLRKTTNLKTEVSIDEPLKGDSDGNELLLSDVLGSESDAVGVDVEREDEKKALYRVLDRLSKRERQIITMRFGLGGQKEYTQKETADELGISQSYISRLEKRTIHRLRDELSEHVLGKMTKK